jgi:mono/diheme cytochrome c family protein
MNIRCFLSGRVALCCWLFVMGSMGSAVQAQSPSRGELLYATHCGTCHSTQMHWRETKLTISWATLKAQVRRWQGVARLEWGESEVEDVARYLNETIYRYPEPARVGLLALQPLQR